MKRLICLLAILLVCMGARWRSYYHTRVVSDLGYAEKKVPLYAEKTEINIVYPGESRLTVELRGPNGELAKKLVDRKEGPVKVSFKDDDELELLVKGYWRVRVHADDDKKWAIQFKQTIIRKR